jgi:triacylglycerol lipase
MAWCRANIGIGTEFDKTSEAAARAAHEDTNDPLPFSLKSPLLSRAQVEAAKQAAEASKKAQDAADKVKAAINFPGLPYSLSASVSAYLLDLLDSPAYANLTPSFLREVFNPLTPNRDDIRYYSVASRTDRIPVWHPLWLPKQVLDGAEAARRAQGIEIEERWRGNDGLVTIESAKWGEFLGVVENCDHWEMRGSSGLVSAAASAKAVAEVTRLAASSEGNVKTKGWQWQDLYSLVGTNQSKRSTTSRKEDIGAASVEKVEKATSTLAQSEDAKGLASFATWIVRHLPGIPSTSTPPDDMASNTDLPNIAGSSPPLPGLSKSPSSASPSARMLYGAPASSPAKPDKFNLEQMALAICRKLHNEGL